MSTFYLTPRELGLPLPPVPPHHAILSHRQRDTVTRRMLDTGKTGGRYASSPRTEGERTPDSAGRSRSPMTQPLRNRQLPASFWQEPNVPQGSPGYPFLPYPFHINHFHSAWADPAGASSSSGQANEGGRGGNGGSGNRTGHVHKEFLERLQSAQVRGYDLAASRFPITEFLFYNYGLRSYLDPTSAGADSPLALAGSAHRLRGPSPTCSAFRSDGASGKSSIPKFSGAGQQAQGALLRIPGAESGNVALTFPTLCPYLGYNCPNLHSGSPHRFWDCVLGQAAAASSLSSSAVSEAASGQSVGPLWKPVGDRTASVYPRRFHPFANA